MKGFVRKNLTNKREGIYGVKGGDVGGGVVQLKGANYDEWARLMRTALRAKKKQGFIDGTVTQPDDDSSNLENRWTVNSMLVSWILNTIELTLRSTITHGRGEAMSFAVQANTGDKRHGGEAKDKTVVCSNCNSGGHEPDKCFEVIGYPEWAHRANSAQMIGSLPSAGVTNCQVAGSGVMSGKQWIALLNLLSSCKSNTNEKLSGKNALNWIIDSGTSHHMTGRIECVTDLKDILKCAVGLANGNQTMALKEGSIRLGKHMHLENVLYVPSLNCNLISV
ncbi:hypothetical protein BUALT_Bualt10G0008100 [Buddleja alternifolia]|uniref:Retrotransposon Copia-like N-terminal domain-containing protein n=1 Tax=Buddleja alternifolia TaxID=168488 RepID=A0AAV6X5R3_9LAMI|nr:hypothetical protein BUALT_Bualt10G0008100 [Buddleja alternifolia]